MLVYLLTLLLSPFCLYLAEKTEKWAAFALRVVAIAIPCMVAGARADSVGTDTALYGGPGFVSASESSWSEYYAAFAGWHPLGYCAYTWLIAQLFNSRFIYLASIQLLAIAPSYFAIRKYGRGCEWLGMVVYLLLLFPISLNAMKQSIAFGFGALAIVDAWQGGRGRFIFLVVAALLFHPTAIVLLGAYPVARVFHRAVAASNKKQSQCMLICVLGLMSLFVIFAFIGKTLIPLIAQTRESFSFVLMHMGEGQFNESSLFILSASFPVFLFDLFSPRLDGGKLVITERLRPGADIRGYLFCVFAIGCLAAQLDVVSLSLSRFSYYGFVAAPVFIASFAKEKMNGFLQGHLGIEGRHELSTLCSLNAYKCFVVIFVLAFIAYFFFVFVARGSAEIYPYRFY